MDEINLTVLSGIIYLIGLLLAVIGICFLVRLLWIKDESMIIYEAMQTLNSDVMLEKRKKAQDQDDENDKGDFQLEYIDNIAKDYANRAIYLSRLNKKINTVSMAVLLSLGTTLLLTSVQEGVVKIGTFNAMIAFITPILSSVWIHMTSINNVRSEYLKLLINYRLREEKISERDDKKEISKWEKEQKRVRTNLKVVCLSDE